MSEELSSDSTVLVTEDSPTNTLPEIVQRYSSGESIQGIAESYSVSRQTIYEWMLTDLGDKSYEKTVSKALVRRISDADEKLENAQTPLDIARAREMARFARMDYERRRPQFYGPKQFVGVDKRVTVRVDRSAALSNSQTDQQVTAASTLPTQE